ncbi:type I-E CRISPR-associated protein Cas5/CasD [Shewanella sp. Isolate7]|uniref:type I-E CRISPR-associated protein Cas5/CasD n=1 Tax=Shewanella sp. Isolate7 TaxID=2908528 RepID=UPI001EFE2B01|nr:type I-E CRISPR-associated protein Cas5/CasD [Shewanella sp. Isolate7]MCG9722928.1 type I-E CRISPR-associated protein Cas5/CasD [Shewanella sp. Isolate7]
MDYLVFRLYGAMASWGEAAVGGDRPTATYPSRSAIIGLLAAALGIKREDNVRMGQLISCVRLAVKQTSAGVLNRDFHTAQVPSFNKKVVHNTRKDELSGEGHKLNTILSKRDYRCDGLWTVAIRLTEQAEFDLVQLSTALQKPKFTLYLGRKSCPLSAPVSARQIFCESLQQALDTEFPPLLSEGKDPFWLRLPKQVTYYWQGNKDDIHGGHVETHQVWDQPTDRLRWQFTSREEHRVTKELVHHVSK